MSETDKINVDSIISRLLEVRGSRPGKAVQLTEAEIRGLCLKVKISCLCISILFCSEKILAKKLCNVTYV